jgi:citronellol/citronellal dehydrogenase
MAQRAALVTGASSGIGLAIAHMLGEEGHGLTIAARRPEKLEAAAEELRGAGYDVESVPAMLTEEEEIKKVVAAHRERYGRLDVLVNNAGGQYFAPAEMVEWKGWNAVMRLNVEGTLRMAEAAYAQAFKPAGGGTILNVTLSPHHGMPGMVHSGAARAAVEALTRELAARWRGDDVAVIALAAGHFATPVLAKYPEQVQRSVASTPPLGRLGLPEEHGWLVAFCCTDPGRALSGSVVTLDGARDNHLGRWPADTLVDDAGNVPIEARRAAPPPG